MPDYEKGYYFKLGSKSCLADFERIKNEKNYFAICNVS